MTTQKTASVSPTPSPSPTRTLVTDGRKSWVKKSPVAIVLEQIQKQEKMVAGMRAELTREERELTKLQQAKKVLEAV